MEEQQGDVEVHSMEDIVETGEKEGPAPPEALKSINFDSYAVTAAPPREEGGGGEEGEPPTKKQRTVPTVDQELSMRELMAILAKCSKDFPEQTARVLSARKLTPKKLDALSKEELSDVIKIVRFEIGAKTGGIINEWAKDVCLHGYENFCVGMGLKVEGIASLASNDPEFNDLWNEMSIDYMHLCYIDPKYRMVMYVFKMTYMVHKKNSAYETMGKAIDEKAPVAAPPSAESGDFAHLQKLKEGAVAGGEDEEEATEEPLADKRGKRKRGQAPTLMDAYRERHPELCGEEEEGEGEDLLKTAAEDDEEYDSTFYTDEDLRAIDDAEIEE